VSSLSRKNFVIAGNEQGCANAMTWQSMRDRYPLVGYITGL